MRRGPHGVPISQATDPKNHPYSTESTGRFVASPYFDFAQHAIDVEKKKRRDAAGDDDLPTLWVVELEQLEPPDDDG